VSELCHAEGERLDGFQPAGMTVFIIRSTAGGTAPSEVEKFVFGDSISSK
jgi:hypothetical protein